MFKTSLMLVGLAAAAVPQADRDDTLPFRLKEESLTIEYTATSEQAVVVFEAESETGMQQVRIFDPRGRHVGRIATGSGDDVDVSGYVLESGETSLAELRTRFVAGSYLMDARSRDGRRATGSAVLSHALLDPPFVIYPVEGAVDVPTTLTVGWVGDPRAAGYEVVLEQGDADTMKVRLPADATSLVVPPGVLAPGRATQVEVGVVAKSGNRTLVEVAFRTR